MNWGKIKVGFWSAIGGAIVLAIIGFNWGGWVSGVTAREMAEEMAADAVVDRLTLICVAQFTQDPEQAQKINELKKKGFFDRQKYVENQGWATMLDETKPDSKVADACTDQILKMG